MSQDKKIRFRSSFSKLEDAYGAGILSSYHPPSITHYMENGPLVLFPSILIGVAESIALLYIFYLLRGTIAVNTWFIVIPFSVSLLIGYLAQLHILRENNDETPRILCGMYFSALAGLASKIYLLVRVTLTYQSVLRSIKTATFLVDFVTSDIVEETLVHSTKFVVPDVVVIFVAIVFDLVLWWGLTFKDNDTTKYKFELVISTLSSVLGFFYMFFFLVFISRLDGIRFFHMFFRYLPWLFLAIAILRTGYSLVVFVKCTPFDCVYTEISGAKNVEQRYCHVLALFDIIFQMFVTAAVSFSIAFNSGNLKENIVYLCLIALAERISDVLINVGMVFQELLQPPYHLSGQPRDFPKSFCAPVKDWCCCKNLPE